jgi:hypothetical protein
MLQVSRVAISRRQSITNGSLDSDELNSDPVLRAIKSKLSRKKGKKLDLIDFVYCWAGEGQQMDYRNGDLEASESQHHNEGYGFNEMELSLVSTLLFAPWLHKVHILVNGPAELPRWAPMDARIQMVDRCALFPRKEDCPTKNTAACQTVMHRIPGLQEHFIAMQDDFVFVRPVKPLDFFTSDGRPIITTTMHDKTIHTLYPGLNEVSEIKKFAKTLVPSYQTFRPGPDMPPSHVPYRINHFIHRPVPMLASFNHALEEGYGEWFAFVRSHKTRFVCCDASYYAHSTQEDLFPIYPAMLKKLEMGYESPLAPKRDTRCECDRVELVSCIESHIKYNKMVTVQSCTDHRQFQLAKNLLVHQMDVFAGSTVRGISPESTYNGAFKSCSAMTVLGILVMVMAVLGVRIYNTNPLEIKAAEKVGDTRRASGHK